jgi:hypothetical protein
MEVLHECCCGLDVHAKTVVACLIEKGRKAIRTFSTMTDELLGLADWLTSAGCTHVAIESTGVYWKPIFNILGNCSRGGLCMKPAKNGHFATGILPPALVSPPKNRANLPRSRGSRGRKRKFPGFFASFLVFVYQYSISPPRERVQKTFLISWISLWVRRLRL